MLKIIIAGLSLMHFGIAAAPGQTQAEIPALSAAIGNKFGSAVAINENFCVVGVPGADSAYVFQIINDQKQENSRTPLIASGADFGGEFGHSVAIFGDFIVVGEPQKDSVGAVYVFKHSGQAWEEDVKLTAGNLRTGDEFGHSVAISEEFIVVGRPNQNTTSGSVHIFRFDGSAWEPDTTLSINGASNKFGFSVAIKGRTLAVGDPRDNAVHVFKLDGTWQPVERISDPTIGDNLGWAVDISEDGEFVVMGAPARNSQGDISGAACVYNMPNGTLASLATGLIKPGDNYGWSVALSGHFIVVGAPLQDNNSAINAGAAFKFVRRDSAWQFSEEINPGASLDERDRFGWSIAIAGGTDNGLVGAPNETANGKAILIDLNKPPLIKNGISNSTLTVDAVDSIIVDLNDIFEDPDALSSDRLSFAVNSSDSQVAAAEIVADTTLKVFLTSPEVGAAAAITVTAFDLENESTLDSFTVFANRRPRVINAFPDTVFLTLDCASSFQRDLTEVFNDSDNVNLTFTQSNSMPGVASETRSGNTLNVSPVAVGNTEIIVNADDERGGQASTSFIVTVRENQPPSIVSEISEIVFSTECGEFTQDLSGSRVIFTDPEGDSLTFFAESLNPDIAIAAISGDTLTVSRISSSDGDSTTIVLTAIDKCSTATSMMISVRISSNKLPLIVNPIPEQILTVGAADFTKDLNEVFADPEQDPVEYTANSSDTTIAAAMISGNMLHVSLKNPAELDRAIITVSANDGAACSIVDTFDLAVNFPPKVDHQCIAAPVPNATAQPVNFRVTDDLGLDSVMFSFKNSDGNFEDSIVQGSGDSYMGTVPEAAVTSRGVEYKILATDSFGARAPEHLCAARVRISDPGVTFGDLPTGTKEADYRLFSVPLEIDASSAAAVLQDDLGTYDKKKWRFLALKPDNNGEDDFNLVMNRDIDAGQAFWLLVSPEHQKTVEGRGIDTGAGTTFLSNKPFKIPLNAGWTFVGNPFDFAIPAGNICLASGNTPQFRTWNGDWRQGLPSDLLGRFQGFAIRSSATPDSIIIKPSLSSGTGTQCNPTSQENLSESVLWSIQIAAQKQNAVDAENFARAASKAFHEHDQLDWFEPPVIGDYVSLYFPHQEWSELRGNYSIDTRPQPATGETWDFEIKTQNTAKVDLFFEGLEDVPPRLEIWLIDEVLNISQNLREDKTYSVAVLGRENPRPLKLVVGSADFIGDKTFASTIIPLNYELSQNFPNPFNPATSIRYSLPKTEKVSLKIYNLLGEEVISLVQDEEKSAGHHTAVWDGRNNTGQPVSSGLYLYRLQAGNNIIIKKMAFVK